MFLTGAQKAERSKHWYSELGGLIATSPDLSVSPLPTAAFTWVGRVNALLDEMGEIALSTSFKMAFEYRSGSTLSSPQMEAEKMRTALYIALGKAERLAPAATRGAYIPVGSAHDALVAISGLLGKATDDVLIVDPYASQIILNDFALSLGEGVRLRLLSGHKKTADDLTPALRAWQQQRKSRPVDVRKAKQQSLHDRVIIVDGAAWWLSQSFNALANRSPATLQMFDTDIGQQKAAYYEGLWKTADPLSTD